ERSDKLRRLNDIVRDDFRTFFSYTENTELWRLRALDLLTENNQIILLSRIMDGTIRPPGASLDPSPGLSSSMVRDLERYAEAPGFSGVTEAPRGPTTEDAEMWLSQNSPADEDEYGQLDEASRGISSNVYTAWPYKRTGLMISGWSQN